MSADDKNFFDLQRLKMIDEDSNRRRKSFLFQSTEEERQDAEEDNVPTIFKMAKERITNLLCAAKRRKTTPTADEYDGEGAPEQTLEEDYHDDEEGSVGGSFVWLLANGDYWLKDYLWAAATIWAASYSAYFNKRHS